MSKATLQGVSRRNFLTYAGVGALTVGAFALAGCSIGGGGAPGSATVRFAWWGGADRQKAYLAGMELFGKENPGITVEPEFGDYDAYQERMTTQMAARDVPEVFWVPSPAVLTYRDANIYRALDDVGTLDLSAFSEAELDLYRLDGKLDTLPKSMFNPVIRYNQTFMEQAGLSIPESITWDDLAELLTDYAGNNAEGRKGTSYGAYHDMPFESFLRQHGEDLWSQDGRLAASEDGVAEWIEWWEKLRKSGATTSISEQDGIEPGWSDTGDKVLATFANSNHIVDEAAAFPDYVFEQRDIPALSDAAAGYHFTYFSRFAMYAGIEDDRVESAGELMSYNLNSIDLLKLVGLSAGAPPSLSLLDEYEPIATPDEQKVIEITRAVAETEQRPRFEAPAGSGSWRTVMIRELEGVTLGDTSVSAAAASFVETVSSSIGND